MNDYNTELDKFANMMFRMPFHLLKTNEQEEVEEAVHQYLFNQGSSSEEIEDESIKHELTLVMFEELLKPKNLIQQFESMEEFKAWMETGYLEDLKEHLRDFEKDEYYEYCCIIRDIISEREIELTLEKMGVDISRNEEGSVFRSLE